ncbi:MAG: tRNA (adenosine(37)-N6)-threonylcarbamoyltransferase complex ATPase subunit type 1 TsaE [Desulfovibrionales bacterium]
MNHKKVHFPRRRATFYLKDARRTNTLSSCLAECLLDMHLYPVLLLEGGLGAGKTTFIRELVNNLPGGHESEVSSPSFNLVNYYPTSPEVSHFDLYRLELTGIDPDLEEEILSGNDKLIVIEWSNFLPPDLQPDKNFRLTFNICPQGREVAIQTDQYDLLDCLTGKAQKKGIPFQEENQCV